MSHTMSAKKNCILEISLEQKNSLSTHISIVLKTSFKNEKQNDMISDIVYKFFTFSVYFFMLSFFL